MTAFLFAFLATLAAGFGARDQQLVAVLRDRLGASFALLVLAAASAAVAALLAALIGTLLGSTMSRDASTMFVAIALLVASIECAWPRRKAAPKEPTRSLGAIGISFGVAGHRRNHQGLDVRRPCQREFLMFCLVLAQ